MIFHPQQTQLTVFLLLFVCVCDYVAVTICVLFFRGHLSKWLDKHQNCHRSFHCDFLINCDPIWGQIY